MINATKPFRSQHWKKMNKFSANKKLEDVLLMPKVY